MICGVVWCGVVAVWREVWFGSVGTVWVLVEVIG